MSTCSVFDLHHWEKRHFTSTKQEQTPWYLSFCVLSACVSVFYLVVFHVLTSYTCGSYYLLSFPLWEVLGHTCGPSVALPSGCWDMPVYVSRAAFREDAQCCALLFVIQPLCLCSCHLLHSADFYTQKGAVSFSSVSKAIWFPLPFLSTCYCFFSFSPILWDTF